MQGPRFPGLRFLVLLGLYLTGAWLAVRFIRGPDEVALFWPPLGLALAAMVRYGLRWVGLIVVGVVLAHVLFNPVPLTFMPFSVLSNVLGALAGAGYLRRVPPERFLTVAGGLAVVRATLLTSALCAALGVPGLVWSGMIPADEFLPALAQWAMSDVLGIISVAPTALLLLPPRPAPPDLTGVEDYAPVRERLAWTALMLLGFALTAWGARSGGAYSLGLASLPLGLLIWSALRFPALWTTTGTMVTAVVLTTMTGLGLTGFLRPNQPLDSTVLLIFLSLLSTLPLVLMAAAYERRVAARRLLRRATTDLLTGLPNRSAFEERVRAVLAADAAPPQALAYVDLDHFKVVNDTASHAAGDTLVRGIAGLLSAQLRVDDLLARIGGDEFALLLSDSVPEQAEARAQELRRAIEAYRCVWDERVLASTASIGLAPFHPGQVDYAELLSLADAACFTAKELGGNRVCVAGPEGGEVLDRTAAMRWAVRIREALEQRTFRLYCQSIVPLRDEPDGGRHFEVLLRMRDPDSGKLMMPGEFMSAAERFHLGVLVDRHVIDLALSWFDAHPEATATVATCSINLSAETLVDEEFTLWLARRLRRERLPVNRLCLEITETSAVRDLARAQRFITEMRALGCRFALDDFGTGFCSFSYLRALDVDYFKIDGSFVRELDTSPLAAAVVRSITEIAHVLHKRTIAEHTESERLCASLTVLGVDYAQGYAFDQPRPIDEYFGVAPP